jgi:hypothetical protein
MRSLPGNPYDGHTLAEALEQAAILCDATPEVAIVDRGYTSVAVGKTNCSRRTIQTHNRGRERHSVAGTGALCSRPAECVSSEK